jgi:hypothetical protein
MAHDERLNVPDFASNPAAFAGRTVEVQARVVAINADGQSLELSKAARKALIRSSGLDVCRTSDNSRRECPMV